MTAIRICFVGDSLTNGTGDAQFLGWPGRLCADEARRGHDMTLHNLGVRSDTTELIARRWRSECAARLPDVFNGALVFMFGTNDMAEEEDGRLRVDMDCSVASARAIVGAARAWKPTLWLSPLPVVEAKMPFRSADGRLRDLRNARLAELSAAYAGVARELGVPYFDLFAELHEDGRWKAAMALGDGVHPPGDGYAIVSGRVGGWAPWRAWFA